MDEFSVIVNKVFSQISKRILSDQAGCMKMWKLNDYFNRYLVKKEPRVHSSLEIIGNSITSRFLHEAAQF